MYTPLRLYAVHRSTIDIFKPEEITPQEFQALIDIETKLYISVRRESDNERIGLNYGRMASENTIGDYTDWATFGYCLSDALVLGYSEDIPGYKYEDDSPDFSVVTWDVLNCLNKFHAIYGDAYKGVDGLFAARHMLHDLSITIQEDPEGEIPILANCIPVINGFVCRPRWTGEKLYALDGSKLCRCVDANYTPEVMLMDFSRLGDISVHNVYCDEVEDRDFAIYFDNRTNGVSLDNEWVFSSKYSLYEYTPIVVIMGIPVFPDRIMLRGEYSFAISPHFLPLSKAMALRGFCMANYNSASAVAYNDEHVFVSIMKELRKNTVEISKSCFVILVKTPRLYVSRVGTDVWQNGITVDVYAEDCLLLHDRTGRIINYHCDTYTTRKELTLQLCPGIYMMDNPIDGNPLCTIRPDCGVKDTRFPLSEEQHPPFDNLFGGNCTMVYLYK